MSMKPRREGADIVRGKGRLVTTNESTSEYCILWKMRKYDEVFEGEDTSVVNINHSQTLVRYAACSCYDVQKLEHPEKTDRNTSFKLDLAHGTRRTLHFRLDSTSSIALIYYLPCFLHCDVW